MIKHHFSLICGHAVVDERTKLLSAFDIIEQINVNANEDETIQIPMHFDLISAWIRDEKGKSENATSRISLCKPKEIVNEIKVIDIKITGSTFYRSIISFSGIKLTGPGLYKFLIEIKQEDKDWEEVAEIPFIVSYKPREKTN